jgi:hypothetical protein
MNMTRKFWGSCVSKKWRFTRPILYVFSNFTFSIPCTVIQFIQL